MASSSALTKTVAALMVVLFAGHLLAATPAAADGLVGRKSLKKGLSPVDCFIDRCSDHRCKTACFRECFEQCIASPEAKFEICKEHCLVYKCKI
jgi:hypothetical protein